MTTNLTNNATPMAMKGNQSIITALNSMMMDTKPHPFDESFISPTTNRKIDDTAQHLLKDDE